MSLTNIKSRFTDMLVSKRQKPILTMGKPPPGFTDFLTPTSPGSLSPNITSATHKNGFLTPTESDSVDIKRLSIKAAEALNNAAPQTQITEIPLSPPASDDSDSEAQQTNKNPPPETYSFPLPPTPVPVSPLAIDKDTPDAWVPRDPRLIRLTGVHPFNVEPPLEDLYSSGFITPVSLFYVRNHGAVPQVMDQEIPDWEISIEGLVKNPIKLTFKQILEEFEQLTLPITMVCAGNRRKEQNMVRKSKGFSWGAAGVSTALWTGPLLKHILAKAKPLRKGRYVCMEGADKLPNGYYGTSIKMGWVMDENRGIMLAHKMNGETLEPDHGKPIRVVIPGMIGGRSVKWLKRLIITEEPSDNWYHIYDNRVLPTMISPEMSQDPSWWTDERYAIYDLSTNSAVAHPQHGETLNLLTAPETYKLEGYAYTGGGRLISRVEISLDRGSTWQLASVTYPEELYRKPLSLLSSSNPPSLSSSSSTSSESEEEEDEEDRYLYGGKLPSSTYTPYHCWTFWSLDLPVSSLADSEGILLRAMDESMNLQPREMYWSVLGMMNNPWFRVAIRREGDVIRFEHPTQPALIPGGWMERVKKEGGVLTSANWGEISGKADGDLPLERILEEGASAKQDIKMTNDEVKRVIEFEEFKAHENKENPWFVVDGEVYDGTDYLEGHPGGATSIIAAAGTDASEEFLAIHSESAKAMMVKYHIGTLSEDGKRRLKDGGAPTEAEGEVSAVFLDPKIWKKAKLVNRRVVSWDTRVFTFELQHPDQVLGLPIGQHLMIKTKDGKTQDTIIRAYTPYSEGTVKGKLELLVKIYFDTPAGPGGKMTLALDALAVGADVDVKGPTGKLEYLERGRLTIGGKERMVKNFCMICAGSGITPIFQVLRAVMQDKDDETRCVVFDGNRLEEDILCREELDEYERLGSAGKCTIFHTLSNPPETWKGLKGRLSKELILQNMPREDVLILVCGPPAMEQSVKQIMLDDGFTENDMVFF